MEFFNPNEFLTYRFFLGVLTLVVLKPRVLRELNIKKFILALPTAVFLSAAMLALWQGVKYSDTGLSAFIVNSEFVLIPIIAYFCFRETISLQTGVLVLIGLVGMALLSLQSSLHVTLGTGYLLCSVLFFAFYAIFNTRLSRKLDPFLLSVLNLSLASVICGVVASIEGYKFGFNSETILPLIYLGPIMTGIRFFVITFGQSKVDAPHAGLIYLCEPVTASIIGYTLLDEKFSILQLVGISLLILTVFGSFKVIGKEEGRTKISS
jgi:drug/metabolite transporter (DMT)-like permease